MDQVLTWGAVVLAGGSIVSVIKFWMDLGGLQQTAKEAIERGVIRDARFELIIREISEYKVSVAQTYATAKSLSDTEQQLGKSVTDSIAGIYSRLESLTQRIDSLIASLTKHS